MKRLLVLSAAMLLGLAGAGQVRADGDPASERLVKLFRDACLPNIGRPDMVAKWAERQQFERIDNPQAIFLFVGKQSPGNAWIVPDPAGRFMLVTRAFPPSCVAYALEARAGEVESGFAAIVKERTKPNSEPRLEQEKLITTSRGRVHSIVYRFPAADGLPDYALTSAVAERPGGPFMGMLQAMRTIGKGPVDPEIPMPMPTPPPGAPPQQQPQQPKN